MSHDNALRIYLNDHLAGSTTGVELARRIAHAHSASADAARLQRLAEDIAQDRRTLLELMARLDVQPHKYKIVGGWAAEKVSRLKPNGRAYRRSRLSPLIELETLRIGIQGKQRLWHALMPVASQTDRLDSQLIAALATRAAEQAAVVDELHERAAAAALSPPAREAGAPGGEGAQP
ncbi:hypothetical protein AB0M39_37900 [Streptomyces sp. NPDC051907]|uniref:hypothetical protein n=1 Tax=Streptomyces sp. NPDC051907 TaxID=3155284 RepID=UPI0034226221